MIGQKGKWVENFLEMIPAWERSGIQLLVQVLKKRRILEEQR
jgi:hypothetical protein